MSSQPRLPQGLERIRAMRTARQLKFGKDGMIGLEDFPEASGRAIRSTYKLREEPIWRTIIKRLMGGVRNVSK
jgi:hypothetical protein